MANLEALNKDEIKNFLFEYSKCEEKTKWSWQRLHYAIEKGYTEIAEFLIVNGDPITSYTEFWKSPLGSNKNMYDYYYKHPLIIAVKHGNVNLVDLMANRIEDLSKVEEYKRILTYLPRSNEFYYKIQEHKTPIFLAIAECNQSYEVTHALLKNGIDVNKIPSTNLTPLITAIQLKKIDIAKLLLDYNADINDCGGACYTPLYIAVHTKYIDGVKLLLDYGADPLQPQHNNPLELAISAGYEDIVDLLLETALKNSSNN